MAYYDGLAADALGRLYWTEEEVLHSDINAIIIGLESHYELLASIFGRKKPPPAGPGAGPGPKKSGPPPLTPAALDGLLGVGKPRRRRK